MIGVFLAAVVGGLEPFVTCEDWRGWTNSVQTVEDGGRDVVTIRLTSPTNAMPPPFGVQLRVSGAGVQNVWTADFLTSDGQHLSHIAHEEAFC